MPFSFTTTKSQNSDDPENQVVMNSLRNQFQDGSNREENIKIQQVNEVLEAEQRTTRSMFQIRESTAIEEASAERKAEIERAELIDGASSSTNEERRLLMAEVTKLRDMLDKESSANELAQEKVRKQLEQMSANLTIKHSLWERNESELISLKLANHDLRQQLLDAESTNMAHLAELHQKLEEVNREKADLSTQVYNLERRLTPGVISSPPASTVATRIGENTGLGLYYIAIWALTRELFLDTGWEFSTNWRSRSAGPYE